MLRNLGRNHDWIKYAVYRTASKLREMQGAHCPASSHFKALSRRVVPEGSVRPRPSAPFLDHQKPPSPLWRISAAGPHVTLSPSP